MVGSSKNMKRILLILLIWGGLFSFWTVLSSIYSADKLAEKSENYLAKMDTEMAEKLINKAINKNGQEPNYYRIKAKILTVGMGSKEDILINLQKALSLNPNNLVTARNCVPLFYFLAINNVSLPASVDNVDEKYIVVARDYFKSVKEKYAHDVGVISLIARYEKKLGLTEDYENSVEIVKGLRPDLLDWYDSFR